MGTTYTKRTLTIEEQINVLKERGLRIDNTSKAKEVLDVVSYFRLAGYWRHLESDHIAHRFRDGSRFEDVLDCYYFDKELRLLLFSAIQGIEVAVRSKVIKHFAPKFGSFWFMDASCATNEDYYRSNLAVIRKEVGRSHDDFITEHFRKYSEPDLPPVWKTLEVISLGTLSKLFTNFIEPTAKHNVAREFGLNHHKFLKSWLESIAVLRNCCAHHARVWDRTFPIQPQTPDKMPNAWLTDFSFRQQTLYPQLCCVVYWLNAIYPDNTLAGDLKGLIRKYPSVNPRLMGFPESWEEEPLWKVASR